MTPKRLTPNLSWTKLGWFPDTTIIATLAALLSECRVSVDGSSFRSIRWIGAGETGTGRTVSKRKTQMILSVGSVIV
ncbi:hypothetical protein RSAG8_07076, partial [Rhizoctonia solani AG-8 WAC10335]